MEVLILQAQSLSLEHVPSVGHTYKFDFPDGTTLIGYARKVYVPRIRVTQQLLDGLRSAGFTPKVKVGQSTAGFEVCIGFEGSNGSGPWVCNFELIDGDKFLRSLFGGKSRCLEETKVQLEVTKMAGPLVDSDTAWCNFINGRAIEVTPEEKSLSFNSGLREPQGVKITTNMGDKWSTYHWMSGGTWTIHLAVKLSRIIGADPDVQDLLAANRSMLSDDVLADTKVVAQNGAEIKFHRGLLAAHSPAFKRMFHPEVQEENSGVLDMPDMTEESVRALKEYLYVWELKAPLENSLVCFELFKASHKYEISKLQEATSKILHRMGGAWYSAAVALRLFLFVKDMELPGLKQKAVEILKLKGTEVITLEQFHDLFKRENVTVAKELTECLLVSP